MTLECCEYIYTSVGIIRIMKREIICMNSHYYKFIIIISHTIGDADLREKEDNTKTKHRGNESTEVQTLGIYLFTCTPLSLSPKYLIV